MQSIKQKFGHLLDSNSIQCKLCETKMKKKTSLIVHMGMVHMKVNDILVEQGFLPIQKDVRFTKNDDDIHSNENESDKVIVADENMWILLIMRPWRLLNPYFAKSVEICLWIWQICGATINHHIIQN